MLLKMTVKKTVNMRRIRRGHSQTDIMEKKYLYVVWSNLQIIVKTIVIIAAFDAATKRRIAIVYLRKIF